jgi:hypothetical protein
MPAPTSEVGEALAEARIDARDLFTGDTCRITRKPPTAGKGTMNETTFQYEGAPDPILVYEGPCRMQVKADINSNVVETTAGDREWTYLTGQLQLPATLAEAKAIAAAYGDTVLGDPNAVDVDNVVNWLTAPDSPSLVGTEFNVAGPYHKTHAAYLRFRVREPVA